jgi:N-acetylglucosamine-6-phosphate deacetylase
MITSPDIEIEYIIACDCITDQVMDVSFAGDELLEMVPSTQTYSDLYIGPGLMDIHINGVNGIDFNNTSLTVAQMIEATAFLLSAGITSFVPTIITNSDEDICTMVQTIAEACVTNELVNQCVWGIHLEGPFLSPVPGAKGAHEEKFIKAPDWQLMEKFQQAAKGKIRIITLAPEWEGAATFIRKCVANDIIVSIGHSMANGEHIQVAMAAGATMATHLGNAVPLTMPRHPNILWELLAADQLSACIIADGLHIPDSFIKVVMKTKGDSTLLVSDATCFAGMAPGEYTNHIGGQVILDIEKRVSLKGTPGLLAGAAKTLMENVETIVQHKLATIGKAWQMASINVLNFLSNTDKTIGDKKDYVIFRIQDDCVKVQKVVKNGKLVVRNQ